MIKSVQLNREMARNAISEFIKNNPSSFDKINELKLIKFTKFLASKMLIRVQDDDCYFVDMLEDIEKLDKND